MSIKVMSAVWETSEQKGSALLLLLAIADFADDTGVAFPSTTTLAKKVRMSGRQVIRLRQHLYESGELEYLAGGHGKGDKMSVRIVFKGDILSPLNDGIRVTSRAERVTPRVERVTSRVTKGDIAVSPDPPMIHHDPPMIHQHPTGGVGELSLGEGEENNNTQTAGMGIPAEVARQWISVVGELTDKQARMLAKRCTTDAQVTATLAAIQIMSDSPSITMPGAFFVKVFDGQYRRQHTGRRLTQEIDLTRYLPQGRPS